ncbi:translation initiation factor IF-2-like [Coturnix japonica]|uniref:translation initiation factor IF-2-like n=1 Tax=Coturnix japonica TaxID=93934 RepID=UPI0013A5EFF9|nr:translation initiation factor IF-2-like [Coturnix japonica]
MKPRHHPSVQPSNFSVTPVSPAVITPSHTPAERGAALRTRTELRQKPASPQRSAPEVTAGWEATHAARSEQTARGSSGQPAPTRRCVTADTLAASTPSAPDVPPQPRSGRGRSAQPPTKRQSAESPLRRVQGRGIPPPTGRSPGGAAAHGAIAARGSRFFVARRGAGEIRSRHVTRRGGGQLWWRCFCFPFDLLFLFRFVCLGFRLPPLAPFRPPPRPGPAAGRGCQARLLPAERRWRRRSRAPERSSAGRGGGIRRRSALPTARPAPGLPTARHGTAVCGCSLQEANLQMKTHEIEPDPARASNMKYASTAPQTA